LSYTKSNKLAMTTKTTLPELEKELARLEAKYNASTGREVYKISKQIDNVKRLIALANFNF
jgi:hypothetical protein